MAVTKILPRNGGLKEAIDYVLNGDKTYGHILTAHFNCDPGREYREMMKTKLETERLDMFVLVCTMAQRTGDERFYPPARQAAGRFAALQKQMGGHTDIYAVDNHSCVINAAMEELAKPERSVEQKTMKKNTPER